jgi:hypothetical protein
VKQKKEQISEIYFAGHLETDQDIIANKFNDYFIHLFLPKTFFQIINRVVKHVKNKRSRGAFMGMLLLDVKKPLFPSGTMRFFINSLGEVVIFF